jgi:hypothetical protein
MSDGRRLLLVTGAAAPSSDSIPPFVKSLLKEASEVLVLTPVLPGRLQWLVSDVDEARHEADERLTTVLGHLGEAEVSAAGAIGDETPLQAFQDAVEDFQPDHILIALRPEASSGWQEPGLIEEVRRRFGLPLTVFELPG